MEFARSLGGDTLTLVSEMPLFLWDRDALAAAGASGRPDRALISRQMVTPMPIRDQMVLQVELLNAALTLVCGDPG
jgi:hypothetical protein